ncbi:MAG: hypothetical protein AUK44_01930 [Porphyromonadaceae bacterium CG2_30_38_12]|nr:MAG: hypothetical protein AUK44_01930 [Porphyromonadaceae bacterium CG2_30_38_12]
MNGMNRINFLFVFISTLVFSSCTSTLYTDIDLLRPAKVTFYKSANHLLLVNNTVAQPAGTGHRIELMNDREKNVSVNTDSLALFCLSASNEEFTNKEFFKSNELYMNSINATGNFLTPSKPNADSLQLLAARYGSDVIVSLDKIKVYDRISDTFLEESGSFYALLEANYESTWTVNYPKLLKYETFVFKDTIFWDSESYQRKKALNDLPSRYNALIDGALFVGHNSVKKFIPYWDKAPRYFYKTNSKFMLQGVDSMYVKNWTAAIALWQKGLYKATKTLRAKLLHNTAVAYEITGDIDKALETIEAAIAEYEAAPVISAEYYFLTTTYREQLKARLKEIAEIKRQLGETD